MKEESTQPSGEQATFDAQVAWETSFVEIRQAIESSYLAEGLSQDGIDVLAGLAHRVRFADGDAIVHQEDEDGHLMILASGGAAIFGVTDEPIAFIKAGMPFGEVALIDEKPRSATVKSLGETEVIVLPADRLRRLLEDEPEIGVVILRNLARVLCGRMRASNQQIAALMTLEELREHRV